MVVGPFGYFVPLVWLVCDVLVVHMVLVPQPFLLTVMTVLNGEGGEGTSKSTCKIVFVESKLS